MVINQVALPAIARIVDHLTNPPLSRFIKVVFLARPPSRKVKPIWSVTTVLEMLRSWGPSGELEQRRLTWHSAMLLALASAHRASDLTLLHMDDIHLFKSADSWRLHLDFGVKQDRQGHLAQDVVLSRQGLVEIMPYFQCR